MSISNTNKGFSLVFIASILELGWVLGLKYATTTPLIIATILVICLNFLVLPQAFKYLPTSIAYIIFVGLGTFFLIAFETASLVSKTLVSSLLLISLYAR